MAAMGSGAWLPVCMERKGVGGRAVELRRIAKKKKKRRGLHKRINNLRKIFAKGKSVWIGNLNPT
jgi:hypothetical protein